MAITRASRIGATVRSNWENKYMAIFSVCFFGAWGFLLLS